MIKRIASTKFFKYCTQDIGAYKEVYKRLIATWFGELHLSCAISNGFILLFDWYLIKFMYPYLSPKMQFFFAYLDLILTPQRLKNPNLGVITYIYNPYIEMAIMLEAL